MRVRTDAWHSVASSKAPAKRSQHCWAQHVACVWPPCCNMLGVVGSNLTIFKFEPITPNMSQYIATSCAQQCCDMLRWHVAIVWPGLNVNPPWKKNHPLAVVHFTTYLANLTQPMRYKESLLFTTFFSVQRTYNLGMKIL